VRETLQPASQKGGSAKWDERKKKGLRSNEGGGAISLKKKRDIYHSQEKEMTRQRGEKRRPLLLLPWRKIFRIFRINEKNHHKGNRFQRRERKNQMLNGGIVGVAPERSLSLFLGDEAMQSQGENLGSGRREGRPSRGWKEKRKSEFSPGGKCKCYPGKRRL